MSNVNSPSNSCYIVILPRRQGESLSQDNIIPFQFMPNVIQVSKQPVYQNIPIIGRSSPLKSYQFSNPKTITFTLDFFANPEQHDTSFGPNKIKKMVDSLLALGYPVYTTYKMAAPPRCLIRIGAQYSIIGVCTGISSQVTNEAPWEVGNNILAHKASVALTFEELVTIPLSYDEARSGLDSSPLGNEMFGDRPQMGGAGRGVGGFGGFGGGVSFGGGISFGGSLTIPQGGGSFSLGIGGIQQTSLGLQGLGQALSVFSGQVGFGIGNSANVLAGQTPNISGNIGGSINIGGGINVGGSIGGGIGGGGFGGL